MSELRGLNGIIAETEVHSRVSQPGGEAGAEVKGAVGRSSPPTRNFGADAGDVVEAGAQAHSRRDAQTARRRPTSRAQFLKSVRGAARPMGSCREFAMRCARRASRSACIGSRASAGRLALDASRGGVSRRQPTPVIGSPSHRICFPWARRSERRTRCGWATSPTSRRTRVGCIWQRSRICTRASS